MSRLSCWNVGGIRAAARKGMVGWLKRDRPHIVAIQEVRARADQLPPELLRLRYHRVLRTAEKAGYSGVALWSRKAPDEAWSALAPRFDREGRFVMARYGRLWVGSAYFPKSAGPQRDNSRLGYKLAFSRALRRALAPLITAGERVVLMGDFNTAPEERDLARPRDNRHNSGFLQEERDDFRAWIADGWVDSFRVFEAGAGHYTWWAQRLNLRERNVGWRIDLIVVSPAVRPYLRAASIQRRVTGSDHCPLHIDLDPAVYA